VYRIKAYVIWVTWSVGKTSCRMIIYQILRNNITDKIIYTSPKNFNSELGLIFSLLKIEKYNSWIKSLIKICFEVIYKSLFQKKLYDLVILEYWIDCPWDMDFLLSIVKPNIWIFTKLDSIHLENFNSKEQIWDEKIKLLIHSKDNVYLNKQDKFLNKKYKDLKINKDYFNIVNNNFEYIKEKNEFFWLLKFGNKEIKTNILWVENYSYIELWYKLLKDLWYKINEKKSYLKLINQWWRFNIFSWINDSILIDSSYNAWPESMKKMIDNTVLLRDNLFKNYKIFFVLWDMRELWTVSGIEHKKLWEYIENKWEIVTVWIETKNNFSKNIQNFEKSYNAWLYLKDFLYNSKEKYIVLFKWSQNTIFLEEALKIVLKDNNDQEKLVRQDETWLEKKKDYIL